MIEDKETLFKALSRGSIKDLKVDTQLFQDKDVLRALISRSVEGEESFIIPEEFFTEDLVEFAISKSVKAFEIIPKSYRENKEFVQKLPLTGQDILILRYASKEILEDRAFILESIKKDRGYLEALNQPAWLRRRDVSESTEETLFYYLGQNLKEDLEIIKAFMIISPWILKDIPSMYLTDRAFAEYCCRLNGIYFEYFTKTFSKDRNLVEIALESNPNSFKYFCESDLDDIDLAEIAIKYNPELLEFCSDRIKNDFGIVRMALEGSYKAYKFASIEIKSDISVIRQVLEKDGFMLEFVPDKFKSNEDVVLLAIMSKRNTGWGGSSLKSSGGAFKFAAGAIKQKKDIAIKALANEGAFGTWGEDHYSEKPLYSFLCVELQNDVDIVKAAIGNNVECIPFLNAELLENDEVREFIKEMRMKSSNDPNLKSDSWDNSGWN